MIDLQAQLDAQIDKNKAQRLKIKSLRRKKTDLKTELKKVYLGLKKMVNLEQNFSLLMSSFEESEKLRIQQR